MTKTIQLIGSLLFIDVLIFSEAWYLNKMTKDVAETELNRETGEFREMKLPMDRLPGSWKWPGSLISYNYHLFILLQIVTKLFFRFCEWATHIHIQNLLFFGETKYHFVCNLIIGNNFMMAFHKFSATSFKAQPNSTKANLKKFDVNYN